VFAFSETVTPRFFEPVSGGESTRGSVICDLCPHRCKLSGNMTGICKTRSGADGGSLPFYGHISSAAIDPIEKKPLFHYRPGESIFSIGFVGCNLRCPFCQNWRISQSTDAETQTFMPEEIIDKTIALGMKQIAYTYSEPLIHAEYIINCMTLARSRKIANVLVTNGCVNERAAGEIIPLVDAVNIDLKCFSDANYKKVLGGSLPAVKYFIKTASENTHTELTTLIIPDFNDNIQEIDGCIDFIASISVNIPWHISAYYPAYKWNFPPASPEAIISIKERAAQKLLYCYTGNINDNGNNTFCLNCGAVLIERNGYKVKILGLIKKHTDNNTYYCGKCGAKTHIRY
jgi:pyruvate formate lyase activating enzyme